MNLLGVDDQGEMVVILIDRQNRVSVQWQGEMGPRGNKRMIESIERAAAEMRGRLGVPIDDPIPPT